MTRSGSAMSFTESWRRHHPRERRHVHRRSGSRSSLETHPWTGTSALTARRSWTPRRSSVPPAGGTRSRHRRPPRPRRRPSIMERYRGTEYDQGAGRERRPRPPAPARQQVGQSGPHHRRRGLRCGPRPLRHDARVHATSSRTRTSPPRPSVSTADQPQPGGLERRPQSPRHERVTTRTRCVQVVAMAPGIARSPRRPARSAATR